MTKQYKTLFPELDLPTACVLIAFPVFLVLLFHFVIDPWTGGDGDDMFLRTYTILSWCEAMILYFMFDGYSQNEQSGIMYLCALPNGRKTVVSAFAGAVVYDLVTMAAAVAASAYFPKLLGENSGVGIKDVILMFACLSAVFGIFIMFCTLTRNHAALLIIYAIIDSIFYLVLFLVPENMIVTICIVSALIYIIGVTFSVVNILKRMKGEGAK